jgi:3-hydroxybutyryl-CoA dehydrogenase
MRVGVVGAGTMGHGIAQLAAQAGWDVTLVDNSADALARGMQRLRTHLDAAVARGKLDPAAAASALARVRPHTELQALSDCELVVEAAPEDLALKQDLLRTLSRIVAESAILASNTSSLSLTALAAAATAPERVVGMHFFNPPTVLTLLELVRAEQTSADTLARAQAIAAALGRDVIVVGDSPGFATSRLGLALGLEAMRMLEAHVASPEDIDRAMELGYRHPMGPLRLTDLVGLDVRLAIAETLHREIGEQFRPPAILRRMVRAGLLGKKTGRGFYSWK